MYFDIQPPNTARAWFTFPPSSSQKPPYHLPYPDSQDTTHSPHLQNPPPVESVSPVYLQKASTFHPQNAATSKRGPHYQSPCPFFGRCMQGLEEFRQRFPFQVVSRMGEGWMRRRNDANWTGMMEEGAGFHRHLCDCKSVSHLQPVKHDGLYILSYQWSRHQYGCSRV
ncbi:hypothetical protein BC829DRAFT_157329 [Chytridium lagenaria]|nr:hypothetical protein BC829DRAFT_157329 [Chytridium lagenaria]